MAGNFINATKIYGGIWRFNESQKTPDCANPDAYLIIGTERALAVDTLQSTTGLYEKIRELTDLPVDAVITHAHPDHLGVSAREFLNAGSKVFLHPKDRPLFEQYELSINKEETTPLEEGMLFKLGGFWLEVRHIPGHTPGSVALLDRRNHIMFSGDSIGSGHFWIASSHMPLFRFVPVITRLYEETKELKDLKIYSGHSYQIPAQLTGQYIKDVLTVTERLVSGAWVGKDAENYKRIGYGTVTDYCYDPKTLTQGLPVPEDEVIKDKFTREEFSDGGLRFTYMFFRPEIKPEEKYPLVVFLHGIGQRGTDGRLALFNCGVTFAKPEWQREHPCFIFAPQCPEDMLWTDDANIRLIVNAIKEFTARYPIDACRVYITGLSMGGMCTWDLIGKYPELFAAAMPICGAGFPEVIKNAKNVPVWAFHAADDPVVDASGPLKNSLFLKRYGTRTLVTALRGIGNPDVRYTEYKPGEMDKLGLNPHQSWVPAYENREAKEWMFSQTRYGKYEAELLRQGVWFIEDFNGSSFYIIEGADRALVIDTGMGGGDVHGLVRMLTKLPFKLALTHGHYDHMKHAAKFGKFYMSAKEMDILPEPGVSREDFMDIGDRDLIDLGGGVVIEVLEIGGHTPGSVAFLDRAHNIIFTGDAIGSGVGVWMQLQGSLNVSEYRDALIRFDGRLSQPGLEDLVFFGGHRRQELGHPKGARYNPLNGNMVKDFIILCGKILNDDVPVSLLPETVPGGTEDDPVLFAEYESAEMLFKESTRR